MSFFLYLRPCVGTVGDQDGTRCGVSLTTPYSLPYRITSVSTSWSNLYCETFLSPWEILHHMWNLFPGNILRARGSPSYEPSPLTSDRWLWLPSRSEWFSVPLRLSDYLFHLLLILRTEVLTVVTSRYQTGIKRRILKGVFTTSWSSDLFDTRFLLMNFIYMRPLRLEVPISILRVLENIFIFKSNGIFLIFRLTVVWRVNVVP